MKRFIFILSIICMLFSTAIGANVLPDSVIINTPNTYGFYQVGNSIIVYSEPDEKSPIKQKIIWSKDDVIPQNLKKPNLFIVYMAKNDFALMSVTDEMEDWVEVIYNRATGEKGWIKKDDPYKFNTWVNFYSMYGRKYGLKILKGAPESVKSMHGTPDDMSKTISVINKPEMINLNIIRGNWMLVTVVDIDKTPKTGYIRWRSDDGDKYLFPDIK